MKRDNTFYFLSRSLAFCLLFLLLAFTAGDTKSEYILPLKANSVCAADLDLDGDDEIIVGHKYDAQSVWGGLSILENDGSGYFFLSDSLFVENGFPFVNIDKFDNNDYPDIFSIHVTANPYTVYAGILYNYGLLNFDSIRSFVINYDEMVDYITSGDVNGDGYCDIVFACNTDQFWGILYNEGTGNFTEPEYYDTGSYPTDLKCADLNNDGKDDIVIASSQVEIYYSSATGFVYNPIGSGADQVALSDFDHDSDIDIIGNAGFGITTLTFYENAGNEQFIIHQLPSFQPNLGNLYSEDFNNDSLPDILLEDVYDLYIFYNEGNFFLSEPSVFQIDEYYFIIHRFGFGDFDKNGFLDIAFTRQLGVYEPNLKILFNDGNGNFVYDPITNTQTSNFEPQIPNLTCYPNPFKTETTIEINIRANEFAELSINNLSGEKVKTLINYHKEGGITIMKWDGLDNGGKPCKPGTYLLTLKVNGNVLQTIKLMKY
jgi:hypothetical protein